MKRFNEAAIRKLKIMICLLWLISGLVITCLQIGQPVAAETVMEFSATRQKPEKPALQEVENFNLLILRRFLTRPDFGNRRLLPPNIHLENFAPTEPGEKESIEYFEKRGWRMGIYLFGRHFAQIQFGEKHSDSRYHLNVPIAVTKTTKTEDLPKAEQLVPQVAEAFDEFQDEETPRTERNLNFALNGWQYYARPVRAVNNSCVECHEGSVAVKINDNQYKRRNRKIGDVNGILVYAFKKK